MAKCTENKSWGTPRAFLVSVAFLRGAAVPTVQGSAVDDQARNPPSAHEQQYHCESFYFKGIIVPWKSPSVNVCDKPKDILNCTESKKQKYRRKQSPQALITCSRTGGNHASLTKHRPEELYAREEGSGLNVILCDFGIMGHKPEICTVIWLF